VLFSYLAEAGKGCDTGVREHNIELALLPLDLREETIEVVKVRHVSLYGTHIFSDLFYRRSQLLFTTPRYKHVGAFVHKLLGRRKANAAIAASNKRNFPFEFTRVFCVYVSFIRR
jgi:hypothetical protein